MDPTQDPFTRRMLQRAVSVQRNRKGSQRKMNILQAIDDKPVKIEDVADYQTDGETTPKFAISMQRVRKSSLSDNDESISRRSSLHGSSPKRRSSSSHLTSESRSNGVCKNAQDFRTTNVRTVRQNRGRDYGKIVTEIQMNGNHPMNETVALENPKEASRNSRSPYRGTEEANSNAEQKSADNYDKSRNSLNLTQTFNSTSLNLTAGNSTKDSLNSSVSYMKGFELGNVRWRGPLYRASYRSQNKRDQEFLSKESETRKFVELSTRPFSLGEPVLVKAIHKQISNPPKMRVEVKTIGNCDKDDGDVKNPAKNNPANKRPDKLTLGVNTAGFESREEISRKFDAVSAESLDSPATPLTAEIRQLDAEIKRLELYSGFRTELASSKKPAVTSEKDSRRNSGKSSSYTSKKPINHPIDDPKETITRGEDNVVINATSTTAEFESSRLTADHKHPAKSDNFKPNMESTRKSSLSNDLSKNTGSPCPRGSTVSTVTIPPDTPEGMENAGTFSSSSPPEEKNLTLESTVPYDVDNFLADALGDELCNTTVTYPPSESHEQSVSQFGVSELISEESTPLQKKKRWFAKKTPTSEPPPPQHGSSFDRTMTLYRSFTTTMKNKLRLGLTSSPKSVTNETATTKESVSENKEIQALRQEADHQQTIIYQANKALLVCRSMKEFASSTEQIELERVLLVAELRRATALDEIKRLENCEMNNNGDEQFCERGEVTIQDFSLPLKEEILKYEATTGDFVQWFVIVVCQGATVWATRPVSCPVQSPGRIIFDGKFSIPNLSADFKISVKIYSLKIRRTSFNHDDKYHLNQAERHARCPSPKKLLKKSERSLSPKEVERLDLSAIKKTSFLFSGMVELYLHDLSLASPWPLIFLKPGSVLTGTIDLSLSCKLHLSVSHAGFLTHADKAGSFVTWNRRWCVLRGQTLKFWNYPCDQEDKEPLDTIDLTNCVSDQISVISRSLCPKPRTLLIETARQRSTSDRNSMLLECRSSCTVVRNLLCCDTNRDLSVWKSKLNHVVSALRDWNVINRFPDIIRQEKSEDVEISDNELWF